MDKVMDEAVREIILQRVQRNQLENFAIALSPDNQLARVYREMDLVTISILLEACILSIEH